MVSFVIHCSDAFLQGKQTFIDLCAFHSSLPVVTLRILSPLTSCKVDQHQLAWNIFVSLFYLHLDKESHTWQIAWERELVSLAAVAWVVLLALASSMIPNNSFAFSAFFSVNPGICMFPFLSSRILSTVFSLRRSRHLPPYISKMLTMTVKFFLVSSNSSCTMSSCSPFIV